MKVICPHCGSELHCSRCGESYRTKEAVRLAIANKVFYCTQCGNEIASTLEEALAKTEE